MSKMIEQVAKAIESAEIGYSITLTKLLDSVSTYTVTLSDSDEVLEFESYSEASDYVSARRQTIRARAAIKAMRDPTPNMIRCGAGPRLGLLESWQAMNDEALK